MPAKTDPIENRAQLIESLEAGNKPKEAWRIGAEHEKFVYRCDNHRSLPYEGDPGIKDVLKGFVQFGWTPVEERGNIIALKQDGASVTLEPSGQLELSGAPLETIHQICNEVTGHLEQAKAIGKALGIGFLGLGFHPTQRRDDVLWMPKRRYEIMRRYMALKGTLGRDMMTRTCTVQVNLDFSSEADMVKKFRVGLALQPLATALFANSPLTDGKPNGFKSFRSWVWTDTDPDRTGMLPFVFEDGFGFERWVDYVLDVPMYFVQRDGDMVDLAGKSFRDFMAGKLAGFEGQKPLFKDWEDHLTTPFPEVRLKTFLEMRGADGGPWARLCALPAFWVGLLYDQTALDAAWDLAKNWTIEEREELRLAAPRHGMQAEIRGRPLADLAKEVLAIADAGLAARARQNSMGESEQGFLSTLWELAEKGMTPADEVLQRFNGPWAGDADRAFAEMSY